MTLDTNILVWVLAGVVGLLVVMNIVLLITSRRKKVEVPDTLPPLSVMSYTQPEANLKEMLQKDIDKKQARIAEIKAQAKVLENEMLALKTSVKELESMRGDVI